MNSHIIKIYFSDFFNIDPHILDKYGAVNISLVSDLPLFIDPFLLFGSSKKEYQHLHSEIIKYLIFLANKSSQDLGKDIYESLFHFKEIKQNWLGFSKNSNNGRALGWRFAQALHRNFNDKYSILRNSPIDTQVHIEKLCLLDKGVGKDNISDFTTNLIKSFLLKYTEKFTLKYLNRSQTRFLSVARSKFNYKFEKWMAEDYTLPYINHDYVILTPKDILMKDDTWINRNDLLNSFEDICASVTNDSLRFEFNNYFQKILNELARGKEKPSSDDKRKAKDMVLSQFPEIIDYYIKSKELHKVEAYNNSVHDVTVTDVMLRQDVSKAREQLTSLKFYSKPVSEQELLEKIDILKNFIEHQGGYKLFYPNGNLCTNEIFVHKLFQFLTLTSNSDVNFEVNNGNGAVDTVFSLGRRDKTLLEIKLGGSSSLPRNLENQLEAYKKSNGTDKGYFLIICFNQKQIEKVYNITKNFPEETKKYFISIDADKSNKTSASKLGTKK